MKKIVILDGKTLGDISIEKLNEIGEVQYYEATDESQVVERIKDANIILRGATDRRLALILTS